MRLGWILYLFFIALLTSQSLMDLSSTLMVGAGLFLLFKKSPTRPHVEFPKFRLEKIFLIWVAIILAGLLWNRQDETPWIKNFLEFRWIIEFYFYIYVLRNYNPHEDQFKKLIPFALIASIYAIVVYFLKYDPITQSWADRAQQLYNYRTGGFLLNPMPFAHTYGPLALVLLGPVLLWGKKELLANKYWLMACVLTLTAVLLSFTRGVWIGIAAGILAMGFLVNVRKGALTLIGLVVLVGIMFATVEPVRERILFSLNPSASYDSERLTIWKANLMMFEEHPWIGIGYSENGRRLREYFDRMNIPEGYLESHAHNQYIHFLAGTGLLGLLCFLFIISFLLRMHYQAYRRFDRPQDIFWKGLILGVIGAEICFYVGGLTESNFSIAKNRYALLMIWALGCWLWFKSQRREVSPIDN